MNLALSFSKSYKRDKLHTGEFNKTNLFFYQSFDLSRSYHSKFLYVANSSFNVLAA